MSDDIRVSAVIALGIDPEKAKQIVAATDATTKGLQAAQKQADELTKKLRQTAEAGAKLREVGTTLAISGGAILAPFIASAQQYVNTYKNLEKTSADYLTAQKKQAQATNDLGRVSASVLIPVMNQVADIEEKIAKFAEDHPDLVRGAVTAGGALVAAGGAIALAGTAITTIAKGAELLKSVAGSGAGNIGGTIGKAVGAVALMGAAAESTILLINEYGKATNDARLATFGWTNVLDEGRQILGSVILVFAADFVNAKTAINLFIDNLGPTVEKLKITFASAFDQISTGVQEFLLKLRSGLGEFINGLLDFVAGLANSLGQSDLAGSLRKAKDPNADRGNRLDKKTDYEVQADQIASDLAKRLATYDKGYGTQDNQASQNAVNTYKQYQTDMSNLGKFADAIGKWVATGNIPGVGGVSGKAATGATSPSPLVSPEAVQAYIDYSQKLKQMDKDDKQSLLDLKKTFDDSEKKAEQEKQTQTDKINADYMANALKETQDFLATEQKEQKTANKERIKLLQDLNDSLFNAAASNDVVGFLNAQRQGKKDLDRQKEDASDADKERIANFQKQQTDEAKQRQKSLDDLNKSFKQQDDARKADYNNQRNALVNKQNQERQLLQQDFAQKLAGLEGNLAGLSSIQQDYYAKQTAAFQTYLDANKDALQQRIRDAYGLASSASGSASVPAGSGSGPTSSGGHRAVPQLATGGDISRDGLFFLHRGEKVLNAQRSNSSGPNVTVDMRGAVLTGGATQADLDKLHRTVLLGVHGALQKGFNGEGG